MYGRGQLGEAQRAAAVQAEQDKARRAHHLAVAAAVSSQAHQPSHGVAAGSVQAAGDAAKQRKEAFLMGDAASPRERVVPISGALASVSIVDVGSGKRQAVKTYDPIRSPSCRQHLENEVALAGRLRHPNILAPLSIERLADGRVALTMDYASGGSLADYVKRAKYAARGPLMVEREAAALLFGVVEAVCYLHANGISHGDLKPGNAMLDRGVVRLIDFGTASFAGTPALPGTLAYTAPEALESYFASNSTLAPPAAVAATKPRDALAADCWALGILLHNILTFGEFAFGGRDEAALARAIGADEPKLPAGLSEHCRMLLTSTLNKAPHARPRADALRRLPWLASLERIDSADPMQATDVSQHLAHLAATDSSERAACAALRAHPEQLVWGARGAVPVIQGGAAAHLHRHR